MSDSAGKFIVAGLLAQYQGLINGDTWPDIENDIVAELVETLGVSEEKAVKILEKALVGA